MFPNARTNDLVLQKTGDELLVYDLITNRAICLNGTSAAVWQMCDGKNSISDLAKELESQLGAAVNEKLVRFALVQLNEVGLLRDQEQFSDKFECLSRREVIKRIGLTSAVAFPIVASLVAPTSAHAQSCPGFKTLMDGDDCMRSCECEDDSPPLCCSIDDDFRCDKFDDPSECLPF